MQPLGVGGVDVRDFEVKNCYESSGRDWSARSAPIGGEGVCLKWVIERLAPPHRVITPPKGRAPHSLRNAAVVEDRHSEL
ncbi:hypothetical protein TNCV_1246091 [Trichonephila clavipes]|uniref:Uncharacterized protein n=1 Tax=Trichonephila clavipes TaxID=2585209 RepID=A0A8X6RFC4_TRICX|nr:hypothetical protein TNCV_1246091 [Trichonephila clavipes]